MLRYHYTFHDNQQTVSMSCQVVNKSTLSSMVHFEQGQGPHLSSIQMLKVVSFKQIFRHIRVSTLGTKLTFPSNQSHHSQPKVTDMRFILLGGKLTTRKIVILSQQHIYRWMGGRLVRQAWHLPGGAGAGGELVVTQGVSGFGDTRQTPALLSGGIQMHQSHHILEAV